MIEIMRASAGSGKTFNLAKKYIQLLLQSGEDDAYRHILAVTFTNKATSEMKSRILEKLDELATNPEDSDYLKDLKEFTGKSEREIQTLSRKYLHSILHDYNAFAVSTIDKFFQQTLKAFSREIGYMASYQIELDKNSLIQEAVDRILDSISEDKKDLISWMNDNMMEQLSSGQHFSMDASLRDIAGKLKSDKFDKVVEDLKLDRKEMFSKENLTSIREECKKIINDFDASLVAAARALLPEIDPKAEKYILPYVNGFEKGKKIPYPSQKTLLKAVEGTEFGRLLDEQYKIYNSAHQVVKLTYGLGFSREFLEEFDAMLKEKNVLSLDDSNTLLKKIIDGSDAPFIYEKLGVRFKNYLLDEFQDTSHIQWENFLPLLKESDDNGNYNLVVGDVKQSIYRWRDSDWKLLDNQVSQSFPDARQENPLEGNYRSLENIVDFNSRFFEDAVKRIEGQFGGIDGRKITDIYAGVRQKNCLKDDQKGFVKVSFFSKEGKGEQDPQLNCILESVREAIQAGAKFGDIAVLVRRNQEGEKVADFLMENGIDVISDDSLNALSSRIVRYVVAELSLLDNPKDTVCSFLCADIDITIPDNYHSLVDLCENLLRQLEQQLPEEYSQEALYVQTFMDFLQDWVLRYDNNLHSFLKYLKEQKTVEVSSPEDSNAVRIMTIHKSKGLEFPYVIIPFAEGIEFKGRKNWGWCGFKNSVFPIEFTKQETPNTLFSAQFEYEKKLLAIDALNLFYVALTRTQKCLHIIAGNLPDACVKAQRDGTPYEFGNMSQILYFFTGGFNVWTMENSSMYDFREMKRKPNTDSPMKSEYHSISIGDRLTASDDAIDFFGEDGLVGADASRRLSGIELHEALSSVNSLEDIDRMSRNRDSDILRERILSHKEWFENRGWNETAVIDAEGGLNRPDRVVEIDGVLTVIDYKFGNPLPSHSRQVRRYMDLYRKMGYEKTEGFVWYVWTDTVERVK